MMHHVEPFVGAAFPERSVEGDHCAAFVELLLSDDPAAAAAFVHELVADGMSLQRVYLELFTKAARELGVMWETDTCDFVDVTVGVGRMHTLLRGFSHVFVADGVHIAPHGRVLMSSLRSEQHTFGMVVASEFLLRDGWLVDIGTPWTDHDVLSMVGSESYDIVAFAVGACDNVHRIRQEIRRIRNASRNKSIRVLLGGIGCCEAPDLYTRVGADAQATCAEDAVRVARRLRGVREARHPASLRDKATARHVSIDQALTPPQN